MENLETLQSECAALRLVVSVLIASVPPASQAVLVSNCEGTRKFHADNLLWSTMTDEQIAHIGVVIHALVSPQNVQRGP